MTKDLQLSFTDKEITPWGGLALMNRLLKKMRFREALQAAGLPLQGSNRGYAPEQLIEQFLIGVWCGANRFEHMEVTRQDEAIRQIFGYERMAGHKAFMRHFGKFTQGTNQRVFGHLYRWFYEQLSFDNFTLDMDSTVMSRYGNQEGARRGYNPHKPGRATPIIRCWRLWLIAGWWPTAGSEQEMHIQQTTSMVFLVILWRSFQARR